MAKAPEIENAEPELAPAQNGSMQTGVFQVTNEMLYRRLGQKDMEIALLQEQLAQAQQLLVQAYARLTPVDGVSGDESGGGE